MLEDSTQGLLVPQRDSDGNMIGVPRTGRHGQIFGGQISAQSLTSAADSISPGQSPHSLHVTYLAAGDPAGTIVYEPTLVKAGRTISIAKVEAFQGSKHLANATVSFHSGETSDEHSVTPDPAPAPEHCPAVDMEQIGGPSQAWEYVDARVIAFDSGGDAPSMSVWMRWAAALGPHPALNAAAFAWMTDLLIVRTSRLRVPPNAPRVSASSLDHSVWIHRDFSADSWLRLDCVSLVRAGARAFGEVRAYSPAGQLVATAAQECLVR